MRRNNYVIRKIKNALTSFPARYIVKGSRQSKMKQISKRQTENQDCSHVENIKAKLMLRNYR